MHHYHIIVHAKDVKTTIRRRHHGRLTLETPAQGFPVALPSVLVGFADPVVAFGPEREEHQGRVVVAAGRVYRYEGLGANFPAAG